MIVPTCYVEKEGGAYKDWDDRVDIHQLTLDGFTLGLSHIIIPVVGGVDITIHAIIWIRSDGITIGRWDTYNGWTERLDVTPPSAPVTTNSVSDGSTASYYELPPASSQLQDLISHKDMNAQIGEIFRACYRYGEVEHSPRLRDAKKIRFYIEAEIERLEKLEDEEIPFCTYN